MGSPTNQLTSIFKFGKSGEKHRKNSLEKGNRRQSHERGKIIREKEGIFDEVG